MPEAGLSSAPALRAISIERVGAVALVLLVLVVWFAALAARPLFNPDEGRYAEIPREMLASGDWLVPHLDGLDYLEKPPLQYWATAVSLALLGRTELAARLYTTLAGFATVLAVALLAARLWGLRAAWRAGAVLISMQLFLVLGQLLTLDMSLTLYMTVALVAFVLAQRAPPPATRGLMLIAWAAAALAVLTKGLEGIVIPAGALVLYSLLTRDAGPWRRLEPVLGPALFLAITVPWFWLVARRQPDFLEFFFVHEHFSRYLTPSANRAAPWWFFGAVLVLGSLPWTLAALRALVRGLWRGAPQPGFDAVRFLGIWVLFVAVFFSLSDSKLIPYLLPAFPPLALLIAALPEGELRIEVVRGAVLTLAAALLCAGASRYGPRLLAPTERNACFAALARPVGEVALLLALTGLYVLTQARRRLARALLVLAAGWCLGGLVLVRAAGATAPIYSGVEIARALPAVPRDVPLYSVGTYDQTLPFYWNRTVTLVRYRGELDYGLKHEPGAELTVPEFIERWRAAAQAYALMERSTFDELERAGLPLKERAHDVRRVLAARR